MQLQRVYVNNGDGTATTTDMCKCADSGVMYRRPTPKKTVDMAQVQKYNMPVIESSATSNNNTMNNTTTASNQTIATARNQNGQLGLARREFMQGAGANVHTYSISFDNASGGDVTAYIGDGNTIAYEANSGTPLPGTVTIGGTWGANSLAIWKLITSNTPVAINKIRISFDATTFLANAALTGYKTRPDAITSTEPFSLTTWISPEQFQSLIVENPFPVSILFDASYALAARIPNGRSATYTMFYVSVSDVHDMRLV